MPVSAGSAALKVVPELSRTFSRELLSQMHHPATRAAERVGDESGRRFGLRFNKRLGAGFGVSAGLARRAAGTISAAFAGVAIVGGIKSAIDAASDLNETLSKSRVIFGRSSREIERWAKGSARNFGLSRNEAIGAAASFGDMFLQLKLGRPQAVNMSRSMVELAADFASFHNADITQVLEAQQAAFRGEYDSLQRFIPNINAARVEQEALRATHKQSAKDLTAAEKAQAIYNIMLRDGARASGDFARTADGAANRQRVLRARVEDLKASIGQGLLPAYAGVLGLINDRFIPAISKLASRVLPDAGRAFGGLRDRLREVTESVGFVNLKVDLQNLTDRAKGWALAIINGFRQGLKSGDWGDFGKLLGKIIGDALTNAFQGGQRLVDALLAALASVDWFAAGKKAAFIAVPFVFGFATKLTDALLQQIKEHPVDTATLILALIPVGRLAGVLEKILGRLPIAGPLLRALTKAGRAVEGPVVGIVQGIARFFGRAIEAAFPGIGRRIGDWVLKWILGISSKYNVMRKAGIDLVASLLRGVTGMTGLVSRNIARVIELLTRPFRGAAGWLIRRGIDLIAGLVRGIAGMIGSVRAWIGRVVGALVSPFRTAGGWLVRRGVDLVRGLISGIRSAIGAVGGVLRSLKDAIVGGIKRLFGIRSPSTVMAGLGANMVAGLVRGLITNQGSLRTIIKSIGGNMVDWFGAVFGGIGQGGTSGPIQLLAQRMAAGYGWTGNQWNALRTLVQNESGWNPNAQNPTSSAYGLFQFLSGTWGSVGATKTSSPIGQIAAGLRYIKTRYGSPAAALSFWLSHTPHWYAGGVDGIFRKPTLIGVGESGAEHVSVTPLHRASGGGLQVTVNLNGPVLGSARQVAAELAPELRKQLRSLGYRDGVRGGG